MIRRVAISAILLSLALVAYSQKPYPPDMPGSEVEVYHTSDGVDLNIYIFNPEDSGADNSRPAIIFFFGGGWRGGTPQQFLEQSKYLASRGMVALVADYRVSSRHGTKVVDCLRDAKAAIRWTRSNAERLGIDPNRIVASGGSAGGHLAAATGTISGLEHEDQNLDISSVPNAMVLFNPAVMLASFDDIRINTKRTKALRERIGAENRSVSPIHHVIKGTPPTIIFHGKVDKTVSIESVIAFTKAMSAKGNDCTLMQYEGEGHGFFNHGRGDGSMYIKTVRCMDEFLEKLGYLAGPPTIR